MPTKLKEPITIVIETVEDAVSVINRLNTEEGLFAKSNRPNRYCGVSHGIFETLRNTLQLQQVDWRTWEPPTPIKIGTHEVEVFPDGSIKAGRTRVDRETILKVKELSDGVVGKKDAEWPKYVTTTNHHDCLLLEQTKKDGVWSVHYTNGTKEVNGLPDDKIQSELKLGTRRYLTPAEAAAILKGE